MTFRDGSENEKDCRAVKFGMAPSHGLKDVIAFIEEGEKGRKFALARQVQIMLSDHIRVNPEVVGQEGQGLPGNGNAFILALTQQSASVDVWVDPEAMDWGTGGSM